MSEIFQFDAGASALPTGNTYPGVRDMAWQACGVEGFWIKPLLGDIGNGVETWLMKVDAGAFAPLHAHDGRWEQVYVLEGSFHDQNRELHVGDFACRAPGAKHTSGSEHGAVVLLVYSPALD